MAEVVLGKYTKVYIMKMTDYDSLTAGTDWSQDSNTNNVSVLTKDISVDDAKSNIESEQFMGNATLEYEKGRDPFNIKLTARIDPAQATLFESLRYGGVDPSGSGDKLILGFEFYDDTGVVVKKEEYKNATFLNFSKKVEADSYLTADLEFQVNVTDSSGNSNVNLNSDFLKA